MALRATQLRSNIYKVLDRVWKTGKSVEVERKGQIFTISPVKPKKTNKLANLKRRNCIIGDPKDLAHIDWSHEWTGEKDQT